MYIKIHDLKYLYKYRYIISKTKTLILAEKQLKNNIILKQKFILIITKRFNLKIQAKKLQTLQPTFYKFQQK